MLVFQVDANTETGAGETQHDARTIEAALLSLGAADDLEAVARAIADSARRFVDAVLVTVTVPSTNKPDTLVIASGSMTAGTEETAVDQLPVHLFSLCTERYDDTTLPVLRIHSDGAAIGKAETALLQRFAPHARLALARAQRLSIITQLAYSDPLTGLANVRGLQDTLSRMAAAANAEGHSFALLIIDLDNFRRYNTLWGHLVGDAALQAFARAIQDATRGRDFVARIGGEEFAVLLPDAGEAEACAVAAHIHAAIADGSSELPSPFTASIGIGLFPNDVPDAFSLYAVADTAMTMAKKAGKNRTFLFESIGRPPA